MGRTSYSKVVTVGLKPWRRADCDRPGGGEEGFVRVADQQRGFLLSLLVSIPQNHTTSSHGAPSIPLPTFISSSLRLSQGNPTL